MPARPVDTASSFAGATHLSWHLAIRTQFLVLGMAMGAWGAQVPSVKSHYALNEQSLSVALLAAAAGAVLCCACSPPAGWWRASARGFASRRPGW